MIRIPARNLRLLRRKSSSLVIPWLLLSLVLTRGADTVCASENPPHGAQGGVPQIPLTCGSERWAVKTLSDEDAPKIKLEKVDRTTVAALNHFARHCQGGPDKRIWPEEFLVYEVLGRVKQVRAEADRDIHIVLVDSERPEETIIVEVPDPQCSGAADSPHVQALKDARSAFNALLRSGKVTAPGPLLGRLVRVRGVGFFDFDHGQAGRSESCIELHPVVQIEAVVGGQ